jgi:hypothetical protein
MDEQATMRLLRDRHAPVERRMKALSEVGRTMPKYADRPYDMALPAEQKVLEELVARSVEPLELRAGAMSVLTEKDPAVALRLCERLVKEIAPPESGPEG